MKSSAHNGLQRRTYAMRRAGLALDKLVAAKTENERKHARRWAFAWAALAKVSAGRRDRH
jgi:hypothetical protein